MHPSLHIAVLAARAAGEYILKYYEQRDTLSIHEKAKNDFFSQVDITAEQLIINMISKSFPTHGFLAEESGSQHIDSDYVWIIDPLDGTTNYLHGYPFFCVSIALKNHARLECGVIYDPLKQECFTTSRGEGARLNDRRLRIKPHSGELTAALLGTTIGCHDDTPFDFQIPYTNLISQAGNIRKTGAAALELAYVAANRLDGFIGFELKPWDIAAGALILQEAGGLISDFSGQHHYLQTGHILGASVKLFKTMTQVIARTCV